MHGAIMTSLQKFVTQTHGEDAWTQILKNAGLWPRIYLLFQIYPDAEAAAIVAQASKLAGQTEQDILRDFGRFIAPDLLHMHPDLMRPSWTTIDVIENTEAVMHKSVRERDPNAAPPYLKCERISEDSIHLYYTSARRLCALIPGIVDGLAEHFGEKIRVAELECMHRGAKGCHFEITKRPGVWVAS